MSRYTHVELVVERKRDRPNEILKLLGEGFKVTNRGVNPTTNAPFMVLTARYTKKTLATIREVAGKLRDSRAIDYLMMRQHAVNPADTAVTRLIG